MDAAALKAAGFSDVEIQKHTNEQKLLAAGFSPEEISAPKVKPSFMDYAKDVAGSGLSGVAQGAAGLVGLPGTISDALSGGLTSLANRVTGANVQIPQSPLSGEAISQKISGAVGGYYEPKTTAGEYARTIGQFAPGMVTGPAGALPRIASAVIPAVASEAAGQATKGTAFEPAARIGGALLAPAGVGLVKRTGASIANALSKAPVKSIVDEAAPTVSQLKEASGNLYDEVFQNPDKNVIISKDALGRLSKEVKKIATEFGYRRSVNKGASSVISEIMNLPKTDSTLVGLESARRLASNVAKNYNTSDGALSGQITKAITNFMDDLDDVDIIGTQAHGIAQNVKTTPNALTVPGSVQPGGVADLTGPSILKNARSTYRTMKKSQTIQNIINNADITAGVNYSQAGVDQALRRGFADLAKNPKRMGQFTLEEQTAIKLAAKGTNVQNALKFLGKFAIRGPVSAGVTSFLGQGLGPAGPYVLAGIGEAAKRGAVSGTQASVDALSALVRGGPSAAQKLQAIKTAKMLENMKSYGGPAAGMVGYAAQPVLGNDQ